MITLPSIFQKQRDMTPDDFKVGNTYQWDENKSIVITDVDRYESYDRRFDKTTITFDIYENGLFPTRIGWSFYVFLGHSEITFPIENTEDDEDEEI